MIVMDDNELAVSCMSAAVEIAHGRKVVVLSNKSFTIEIRRSRNGGWDYQVFLGLTSTVLYQWVGPKTDSCIEVAQEELNLLGHRIIRVS